MARAHLKVSQSPTHAQKKRPRPLPSDESPGPVRHAQRCSIAASALSADPRSQCLRAGGTMLAALDPVKQGLDFDSNADQTGKDSPQGGPSTPAPASSRNPAPPQSPRPAAILPDRITCPQEIRRMLRSFPTGTPQRRPARWPPNPPAKPATIPRPNRGTLKIVLSCDDFLGTIKP
jgi:hypothetical protein